MVVHAALKFISGREYSVNQVCGTILMLGRVFTFHFSVAGCGRKLKTEDPTPDCLRLQWGSPNIYFRPTARSR